MSVLVSLGFFILCLVVCMRRGMLVKMAVYVAGWLVMTALPGTDAHLIPIALLWWVGLPVAMAVVGDWQRLPKRMTANGHVEEHDPAAQARSQLWRYPGGVGAVFGGGHGGGGGHFSGHGGSFGGGGASGGW